MAVVFSWNKVAIMKHEGEVPYEQISIGKTAHDLNPLISASEQRQKSHKKEKILALHCQ